MQNGWGRRHTMSSVDVTTFVIYSLILCAVAQWNLNTTEAPKIEGGRVHAEQKVRLMEQVYLLDLEAIAPLYPQGSAGHGIPNGEQKKQQKKIFEI